jgi:hypothetical protein
LAISCGVKPSESGRAISRRIAQPRSERLSHSIVAGIELVETEELRPGSLVDVPREGPACSTEALALPVDAAEAEVRGSPADETRGRSPAGFVSEAELPALSDEERGELFAVVVAELES